MSKLYNHVDEAYKDIVLDCLSSGRRKPNRTGVDTISTFNFNYELDLRKGFPLLTTKKISWKNIVVEMLWFLSGDTDIKILQNHKCKFWDAWADQEGKVPSAYGNFWRKFPTHGQKIERILLKGAGCADNEDVEIKPEIPFVEENFNDQIKFIIEELRRNPMSRRLVVSAWSPANAQTSKLPPCHCMFIFNVQFDENNKPILCCHLTQRSCDIALGVPYNIASYALLTHIISELVNIPVGIFAHTLVDSHIYTNRTDGSMSEYDHIPNLKEQIVRTPFLMPKLKIAKPAFDEEPWTIDDFAALAKSTTEDILDVFYLEGYKAHPAVEYKVAV